MGASNDNLDAIRAIDPRATRRHEGVHGRPPATCAGRRPETLDGIFRESPVTIITHCEDTPTIDANLAAFQAKYGDDIPVAMRHPDIRSREACIKSTRLAISLARRHGTRCTCFHISTADELALFERGPLIRADGSRKRSPPRPALHFLRFDRGATTPRLGNLIK